MSLHLLCLLLYATLPAAALRCSNTEGTAKNGVGCDCDGKGLLTYATKEYCFLEPNGNAHIGSCSIGSYSSGAINVCFVCPIGQFGPRVDLLNGCKVCPAGQYQDSTQKLSCKQCPKGSYNEDSAVAAAAHDNLSDCEICDDNYYSDRTGAVKCKICPAGKFIKSLLSGTQKQKVTFHSSIKACLDTVLESEKFCGISNPNHRAMIKDGRIVSKSDCVACPKGYQGGPEAVPFYRCVLCKRGYYSEKISSNSCKACTQGDNCEPGATSDRQLPSLLIDEWYSNRTEDIATPILSSSRNLYCREHGYTKMLQDPCDVKKQYISGSTSWYQAPRISGKSLPELKAENIPLRTRNTLYIVVATIVFLLIASHRFCCSCYKNLDLAFADKHYIEDTVSFLLFSVSSVHFNLYCFCFSHTKRLIFSSLLFSTPCDEWTHAWERRLACPFHLSLPRSSFLCLVRQKLSIQRLLFPVPLST